MKFRGIYIHIYSNIEHIIYREIAYDNTENTEKVGYDNNMKGACVSHWFYFQLVMCWC